MTDENKEGGIFELLKRTQGWVATLVGLVTALGSVYLLVKNEPELGVLLVSVVGATVLWLMLWQVYRAKRSSRHDPSKKHNKNSKRQRAIALAGLIILPTMAVLVVYVVTTPPSLPRDRLVVGVALFTPVGGVADEAERFTDSLYSKLRNKKDNDKVSLEAKWLGKRVERTEDERQNAVKLGKSREGLAHIVLWGHVKKTIKEEKIGVSVEPFIAFTESLRKINISETEIGWFPNCDAGFFQLEDIYALDGPEAASKIADIVTFIEGLVYYKLGSWDDAKKIFDKLSYPTKAVDFYKGLCLYEMAQQASDPHPHLGDAESAFKSALGPPPWNLKEELNCAAFLNLTSVVAMLGSGLQPAQRLAQLREVEEAYKIALQFCPKEEPSQNWAVTKNNLGNVLVDSALLSVSENQRFLEAVDAYEDALSVFSKDDRNWAIVQNNLGTAFTELGSRVNGEKGNDYLRKALEAYDAALRVFTYKKSQNNWATITINRGQALTELGGREGAQGMRHLREALEACQSVLSVSKEGGQDWAMASTHLAVALLEVAKQTNGEAGNIFLGRAAESCRAALSAFPEGDLDWAITQETLGSSMRELGMRVGEDAIKCFEEAVAAYRAALRVRDDVEHNQDWAKTQNNLGLSLTELASRVSTQEQGKNLDDAIASFEKALIVYDEESYPQQHKEVRENRERVVNLRMSLLVLAP